MNGYTKLFSSIVSSTIWQEDLATKVVWITMLAMSDSDGMVEGSVPGLAHIAGVTVEECERALTKFQQPDRYSRTPDNEGRRIEVVDGGWFVLNRAKYRDKDWEEDKAERRKEVNRRYYEKTKIKTNSDFKTSELSESDFVRDKKEKEKEKEKEKSFSPFDAQSQTPTDQPAINLAKGLADRLDLVASRFLLQDMEDAIKCAAKRNGGDLARGFDYLLATALKARERGAKLNQKWFTDADGWEPKEKKPKGEQYQDLTEYIRKKRAQEKGESDGISS